MRRFKRQKNEDSNKEGSRRVAGEQYFGGRLYRDDEQPAGRVS